MSGDPTIEGLDLPDPPRRAVETAVRASIEAASLDDRDEGAGELAASLARAVDLAHKRQDPYAIAAAGRELRETLTRLRLDPVAREGNDAGAIEGWLEKLAMPARGDTPAG